MTDWLHSGPMTSKPEITKYILSFRFTREGQMKLSRSCRRADELELTSEDEIALLMSGFLYAARGQRDKIAPNVFREKPELVADGDRAYWIGSIYALLGDQPHALAWLRRAMDLGNHSYPWFVQDKNWTSFAATVIMNACLPRSAITPINTGKNLVLLLSEECWVAAFVRTVGIEGSGGEGGIRTLDRVVRPYNGLANRRLQPLGHLSGVYI